MKGSKKLETNGYKRAMMVELHDSGVIIRPYIPGESVGWIGDLGNRPKYYLRGEDIERLAQIFGLDINEEITEVTADGEKPTFIFPMAIPIIAEHRVTVGAGGWGSLYQWDDHYLEKIDEIWARVDGDSLELKIVFFEGEPEKGEAKWLTRDVTYRGAFTIWWANESDPES